MCGRFVQAQPAAVYADHFAAEVVKTESLQPSYNVAPTDAVYAVAQHESQRQLGTFRWGLVPWWAKDRTVAARNINARSETAATKPTFRESFVSRRCLIPADGFYEWEPRPKGKLPHYIYAADARPLALAGLWASWRDPETEQRLRTCTIITGQPNRLVGRLHDRMPVVLGPGQWDDWLDPALGEVTQLSELLGVYPAELLAEHPVSTLVNKVDNNLAECIAPLDTGAIDQ